MIVVSDVAVTVKDAKASARWWEEKLGFSSHTVGPPGSHAVMVAPAGDRFVLHLCEGFAPVDPGNTGIGFVTDEIDPLVERMVAGGVEFPVPLEGGAVGKRAQFADPDGNIFWLIGAPTPFIREHTGLRGGGAKRRGGKAPAKRPAARRRRR
jgi:catechol 2,3-dioxygenase-like lactoylglutathione lyase family enzyme